MRVIHSSRPSCDLPGGVVVVAVDALGLGGAPADGPTQGRQQGVHHELAVGEGVALRPQHVVHVALELLVGLQEVRQVAVLQRPLQVGAEAAGAVDVASGQPVADAAAARVQHAPHPLVGVEADLHEVVAAAEGAELRAGLGELLACEDLGVRQRVAAQPSLGGSRGPGVGGEPRGDGTLHVGEQRIEAVGEVGGGQVGAHGDHAAAQVHADRGGDDGPPRWG